MKINKFKNDKTVINNHVEEQHFENNFSGIKDLFVGIFGS